MVGVTSSYQQVVIPSMTANTPAQIVGPTGGRIYITGISIDVPANATVTISEGLTSGALTALMPVPTDMLTPANASEFAYYAVSARGNGLWVTSTQNVTTPTVIQFYSDELISTLPTTATPTLNAPSSGYMGETVTVSIANLASYAAGTTIGVNAAGEYAIAGANISWRLPGGATTRSLSVTAQEPGKKLSLAASVSLTVNTYGYPQTVPPSGGGVLPPPPSQTTTPTLSPTSVSGAPSSDQTITISNYNAAFSYRLVASAGTVARSGNTITWTLPGSAGSETLQVFATESGKSESSAGTVTATVTSGSVTTGTPVIYGFLGAVNEGTTATGTIEPAAGGSYSGASYEFSLNGGTSWTAVTGGTAVRVSGTTVSWDIPTTAGNNDTIHTLRMRVTESGKTVSTATGTISVRGRAVLSPDWDNTGLTLTYWASFPLMNSNSFGFVKQTAYGATRAAYLRDLSNNNQGVFAWNAAEAPLTTTSGLAGAQFITSASQLRLVRMMLQGFSTYGSNITGAKATRAALKNVDKYSIIILATPNTSGVSDRGFFGASRATSSTTPRAEARITGGSSANQMRGSASNNDATAVVSTVSVNINPNNTLAVFEWAVDMAAGTLTAYRNGTQVGTVATVPVGALANTDAFNMSLGASILNTPVVAESVIHEVIVVHGTVDATRRTSITNTLTARSNA